MRGWIVAGLVVLAVTAGTGLQSNGVVEDDALPAPDALARATQARDRDTHAIARASMQTGSTDTSAETATPVDDADAPAATGH